MGVMALFHLQKIFSFRYFLKKVGVLDSYFIHRYIIIKYRLSLIKGKICQYYESYGNFLQNACVWVRMPLGVGHLCHTDTFLVSSVSSLSFIFLFLPCPSLSSPLLSLPMGDDMSLNSNTINQLWRNKKRY